ncbi:MAG: hypothetical protein NVSMB45_06600 [Ginsengibacter sp.]
MPTLDKRVDEYIKKAKPFAQPILTHFRQLLHKNCPELVETIKWGFPNFEYKGPFASMAAFKEHCAFGFWKASLMKDADKLKDKQGEAMGHLGRLCSVKDLPSDKILEGYIKEAVQLNVKGVKVTREKKVPKELIIPEELTKALKKNKKAKETFEAFSPSHKREYADWIADAKTDVTREKRLNVAIEMMKEGKSRMDKYQTKK